MEKEEGEISKYERMKNDERIEESKREQNTGGLAPAFPSLGRPAMRVCQHSTLLRQHPAMWPTSALY